MIVLTQSPLSASITYMLLAHAYRGNVKVVLFNAATKNDASASDSTTHHWQRVCAGKITYLAPSRSALMTSLERPAVTWPGTKERILGGVTMNAVPCAAVERGLT
ncbi:hypothetical protein F5B22DRAFT_248184 [Xylaria bambusicola]|uniref:uncharacterized protein n=1 Tax=Xylaria bambusicola TaxID=326684 RepID=UPI002008967D|nr:uncharacterized protein F5B22DRAFT_248184 [Xylaria bambusicola]KAI0513302.1 hypothetical protein F5B22DRAFT_248184 [Xylaria bambusicola]